MFHDPGSPMLLWHTLQERLLSVKSLGSSLKKNHLRCCRKGWLWNMILLRATALVATKTSRNRKRYFFETCKGLLHCGCLGSSVVRAPFMRSGCRGFESYSGHLIFPSICLFIYIGISELTFLMMNEQLKVSKIN